MKSSEDNHHLDVFQSSFKIFIEPLIVYLLMVMHLMLKTIFHDDQKCWSRKVFLLPCSSCH